MADLSQSLIQIKRSKTNAHPGKLRPGELAFSSNESGANANGLGILYIGGATPGADGYANTCHVIGGSHYTNLLDVTAGKLTAGKAIVAGANGEIDHLAVGALNGVEEGGKKVLHLGTDGETVTVIQDPYVKGAGENGADVPLATFIDTLIESGVELVAGNGIETITKNADGAFQIGLKKIHDFSGKEGNVETVGSSTAIPVITINEYGQVTAATTTAISTKLAVDGSEVDLVEGKLATADGVKSTQTSEGVVTVSVDDTVIRTTGGQTIAGTLNVTGQADFGVAPTVGTTETVLTDATVVQALVYQSSEPSTVVCGGYEKGKTFENGVNVLEFIDGLLHPYVQPTPGNVTTSASIGTYEDGADKVVSSATVTWTNGSQMINKVEVLYNGTVVGTKTLSSKVTSTTVNLDSSVTITGDSSVKNFVGKIYDSTSSYTKTSSSFVFVDPYYYGIVAAGTTSLTSDEVKALVATGGKKIESKGNKANLAFNLDNSCAAFAYPKKHGALKEIKDGNGFNSTNAFIQSVTSVECLSGKNVDYYVYILNAPATGSAKYTFNVQ